MLAASTSQLLGSGNRSHSLCQAFRRRCRTAIAILRLPPKGHFVLPRDFKACPGCDSPRRRSAIQMSSTNSGEAQREPSSFAKVQLATAADAIDRIVNKVMDEMIISESVAVLTGDESETKLDGAIRDVLVQEAESLDDTFLAMLMRYTKATKDNGQEQLAQVLARIYELTIEFVTSKMPPELRLLQQLSEEPDTAERDRVLRMAVSGEEGDLPGCDLETLARTSNRMVEDMEARQIVPDRTLLVRVCLVREETRKLAMELKGIDSPEVAKFSSVVPARVSHFIKELMPVNESSRRMALLEKVFRGDWEGAAPPAQETRKERINRAKFKNPDDEAPDVVRPGALLSALLRLQIGMEQDKEKLEANKKKLSRVAEIRHEAVHVMKKVAFG
uniref:Uncharacterized protein n=2 Tax=Tetraselmis sp. GSL018 TaxID=582737 RepID=A0A061S5Q0_9CHLO